MEPNGPVKVHLVCDRRKRWQSIGLPLQFEDAPMRHDAREASVMAHLQTAPSSYHSYILVRVNLDPSK